MSPRTRSTTPRALSASLIAVALLAVFGFAMSRASVAIAQEASPVAGECDAPALPPGSPTPMEASPVADEALAPVAEATPVEEEAPEGTPADQATTDAATAAINNIVGCLNSGNFEGVAALFTPNAVMQLVGTENPYDLLAQGVFEDVTFTDVQVSDVQTYADGRLSAQVDYLQTQYQYVSETWWLVEEGGYWKLDGFDTLTPAPEGDTAVVGVNMTEYEFAPNVASVVQSEVLVLHGINAGAEPHEIVVVRLPEGVTIEQVMADPSLEEQVEFIGFAFFEPGQQGDLALVGLEPGVYTLVCFVEAPDGTPHVALGMVTTIEVTAPEPVEPVASPAA